MKTLCFEPRMLIALGLAVWLLVPQAAHSQQAAASRLLPVASARSAGTSSSLEAANSVGASLRFNFRNVPLDTVLDYLGKAAGLVVVREVAVAGRVDAVSHQLLDRAQAVELLNTILNLKGFAAVLSEKTLRIVTLEEARKRDSPVVVGRDSAKIPKTAVVVTQIIPIRYAQAAQLIKNLQPLLPSYASISSNEGSNALVLTATQTDIRRMVRIVEALDTSAQALSTIRVFQLDNADATDMARVITELYKSTGNGAAGSNASNNAQGGMPMPPPMMPGMPEGEMLGGGGSNTNQSSSGGRKPLVQVTALADTRTNAVVVGAPEDLLPGIERLMKQMDISRSKVHEIRVFPLRYADAQSMVQVLGEVYQSGGNGSGSSSSSQGDAMRSMMLGGPMGMGGPPGMGGPMGGFPGDAASGSGAASVSASDPPLIVADVRTNAVVVNADSRLVAQAATLVARLDKSPAKYRKVYVYPLKYADPQKTAQVLQGMFSDGSGGSSASSQNSGQGGIFDNADNSNNTGNNNNTLGNFGRSGGGGSAVPTGLGGLP